LTRIFANSFAKRVVRIAAAPCINPTTNENRAVVLRPSLMNT
jgi:hypothetical protein